MTKPAKREKPLGVGGAIMVLRNLRGYKQARLARAGRVDISFISRIENGLRCVRIEILEGVAGALGVTVPQIDALAQRTPSEVLDRIVSAVTEGRA